MPWNSSFPGRNKQLNSKKLLGQLGPDKERIDAAMKSDLAVVKSTLLVKVLEHGIFNGGKRVRPLLAVLSAMICGTEKTSAAIAFKNNLYRLAMIFEYLHAASLLHDDVIDNADQRRGKQSANVIWGNTPVILAGDFLHTRAMLLAGSIGGKESLEIIADATAAMVEAEFLQIANAETRNLSKDTYFAVLQGKTAALIAAACKVGGIYAGGNDIQCAALFTYGTNLGLAFQVVDDLLDYLGDPSQTGKIVGNDLMEGKITLPLIYTLADADETDRKKIFTILAGDKETKVQSIDTVIHIIKKYNGFKQAREKAEKLIHKAKEALAVFPYGLEKTIMIGLADYILTRKK